MTDYQHFEELVEPLIEQGDQATVNKCALLLFEKMKALTTKLWSNIDKKKKRQKRTLKSRSSWASTK